MILTDKSYIEIPPGCTPLMHYLNIYQLLSILKSKNLVFSSVSLYNDASEATLTSPSYKEVSKYLLWEDNTPVKKDEGYAFRKKHGQHQSDESRYIDTFAYLISSSLSHLNCWV